MGSYHLNETSSGRKTLVYRDSRDVRIHSAVDPVTEAARAVAAFAPGRATMILVSGLGLGYHVAALRERFPDLPLLVIEHDREVIDLARGACPENLADAHIAASVEDLSTLFEDLDMASFRGLAHYCHRPSYQLHREFYDAAYRDLGRLISSKVSDLLTRYEFEEQWLANILANVHFLTSSIRVADLFGAYKGCPGIIVSAGPSLRERAPLLEALRDRALIVCVDTAYKVLLRQGIEPHIVMTLDAQKHSIRHFLGADPGETLLLADLVASPVVIRGWTGRRIISSTAKYYTGADGSLERETTPFMDWVERYIASPGDIQSGGSVATSAFDLLLNLGADPIILVGQDLAYTGREIHASGTHHNDDWLPRTNRFQNLDTINQLVVRKRKIKYVPAYGGRGTVVADFVFDLYRSWFEDSAARVSQTVINASGGGARIAGTREESLSSLLSRLPLLEPTPAAILSRVRPRCDDSTALADAIEAAREAVAAIGRLVDGEAADSEDQVLTIARSIEAAGLAPLFNPFIRRSQTYTARYGSDDRSRSLFIREINRAVSLLMPLLARSGAWLRAPR